MAGAIIAPALPQISREFSHLPQAELLSKLILTLPALFIAVLAPLAGYFTDRSGRKKVLLSSLILYALGGCSGLFFSDIYFILAGRAVLGIAVAGIMTAGITLIGDYFKGEARNRFIGFQSAFSGIGGLIFIASGGILADLHWRLPFLVYFSSLAVALLALKAITEPFPHLPCRNSSSVNRPIAIPSQVYFIYGLVFLSMITFYMIPVQMPFMLSKLQGISNTQVGLAIASMNITSITLAMNYARFRRRLSFSGIMGLSYLLVFLGYWQISRGNTYAAMIVGIMVSGLGFGLIMPNINLWLISVAPAQLRGRLVGYLNSALFLGMFLSPIVLQPLIRKGGLNHTFWNVGLMIMVLGVLLLVWARFSARKSKK